MAEEAHVMGPSLIFRGCTVRFACFCNRSSLEFATKKDRGNTFALTGQTHWCTGEDRKKERKTPSKGNPKLIPGAFGSTPKEVPGDAIAAEMHPKA